MLTPIQLFRRARRTLIGPKPVILLYHRIANLDCDPWHLAVSPANFERQLAALVRHRRPFSLPDFVRRLDCGTLPLNAVTISFDDGYVDNLENAEPRLAAAGVPAMLFLTTGPVAQGGSFWWDDLASIVLDRTDPIEVELEIGNKIIKIALGVPETADDHRSGWRAWNEPRSRREKTYAELWLLLRDLPEYERKRGMTAIRTKFGAAAANERDRALRVGEVQGMARRGIFAIGGHTVNHPALPTLSPHEQRWEIETGKLQVESMCGSQVSDFAYPYGSMDAAVETTVRESGFDWACSTVASAISLTAYNRFALPRIAVPDCTGERLLQILERA